MISPSNTPPKLTPELVSGVGQNYHEGNFRVANRGAALPRPAGAPSKVLRDGPSAATSYASLASIAGRKR